MDELGDEAIFYKSNDGKPKRTWSLRECVKSQLADGCRQRKNLEWLIDLRDGATHLLMPEVAEPVSWLFQASAFNYMARYQEIAGRAALPTTTAGLLSLVTSAPDLGSVDALEKRYGSTVAGELIKLKTDLMRQMQAENHEQFAVEARVELEPGGRAEVLDTTMGPANERSVPNGSVVKKLVRMTDQYQYQYKYKPAVATKKIANELDRTFNSHDFLAATTCEGWRNPHKEGFSCFYPEFNTIMYSDKAVEYIVARVREDPDYLVGVRENYKTRNDDSPS